MQSDSTESRETTAFTGPRYSQNDLVEIEPGQGVLLFGGDQDDPFVVVSEDANDRTQEDLALVLWALHDPRVRKMFRAALAMG